MRECLSLGDLTIDDPGTKEDANEVDKSVVNRNKRRNILRMNMLSAESR